MCVCVLFFFGRETFSILTCGFLALDEFLVIFIKGDHILIYMYIFAIVLLLGTILHCTTWFVWSIYSLELIIIINYNLLISQF